ncbi:hypothetical protein Slin14017_G060910 [Septoria linicola]|nr:hypothetical protein Slin14017_G060910 [Septoria linicola]
MDSLAIFEYTSTLFNSILPSIHLHAWIMAKGKSRQIGHKKGRDRQKNASTSSSSSVDPGGFVLPPTWSVDLRQSSTPDSLRKDSVFENVRRQDEQYARARAAESAGKSREWLQAIHNPLPGVRDWIVSTRVWRRYTRTVGVQGLLINAIGLCIVFSALKVVVDSLLLATRVSAAYSASASTVYIPYTETVTSTALSLARSSGSTGLSQDSSSSTSYTTISTFTTTVSRTITVTASESPSQPTAVFTTTATVTATVSLFSTVTASPPRSTALLGSSTTPAYSFYVSSGSTVWQGGATPSSGVSLSIVTTSVVVTPLPGTSTPAASSSLPSTASTSDALTTFTPPPYSSTTFSVLSSALTTTLTSTHYITRSLSRVSPAPSSSRASFTGMNSAGWNTSSAGDTVQTSLVASIPLRFTRFTRMVYFGHDDITISTSTQLVTATIGQVVGTSSGGSSAESVATTITVGTSPLSLSTGIAFPTAPSASASLPSLFTQIESQSTTATLSTEQSDGIHQTIGASSGSSLSGTAESPSSPLSTNGLPSISSASNGSATASARTGPLTRSPYTITSFLSGKGTTFTVLSSPSPVTPRITVSNGTTYSVTESGSRSPADSSSSRASTLATSLTVTRVITSATTMPVSGGSGISAQTSGVLGSGTSGLSSDLTRSASDATDTTASRVSTSESLPNASPLLSPDSRSSSTSPSASGTSSPTSGQVMVTGPSTRALTSTSSTSFETDSRPGSTSDSGTQSPTSNSGSATSTTSARSSTSPISSRNSTSIASPTRSLSASVSTSTVAGAIPTCGEQGDFTMNFDDLPTFRSGSARLRKRQSSFWNGTSTTSGNGTSDVTQQPPLSLRPYKHMLFSSGYVYSPQPVEPFAPASAPNVAVFLANGTGLRAGPPPPVQNGLEPGEIADGPYHEGNPAFFFDASSAALGCDSQTTPCTMQVTGYTWNNTVKDDVPTYSENYTLPACEGYRNCQLTAVTFPPTFRNLSGIRMRAVRGSEPRTFFADDIKGRWADDSCESGKTRQNSA